MSGRYPGAGTGACRAAAFPACFSWCARRRRTTSSLPGSEVKLRGGQLRVPEHVLDIGQRKRRVLGHPVGRRVPQRVQRRPGPRQPGGPLEHPVRRMVGQRARRAAQRPPHRLPPPLRDQALHLRLVKPQPHERVHGRRQLLHPPRPLPRHRDHLPPRVDTALHRRQQLRRPRPRRDVERHQRPVAVRRQPGEDLVELRIRHAARDPRRDRRAVEPGPLVTVTLHRVVMSVRPPAPPGPLQRERADDRPGPRLQVEIVEAAQHRLRVRPGGRRVRLAVPGFLPGARRLARHLHPPAEITRLRPGRPVPPRPRRPQEPEPPQQVQPV